MSYFGPITVSSLKYGPILTDVTLYIYVPSRGISISNLTKTIILQPSYVLFNTLNKKEVSNRSMTKEVYRLGCANKDLWGLCAPISIIVVYSKTATSYYFWAKE